MKFRGDRVRDEDDDGGVGYPTWKRRETAACSDHRFVIGFLVATAALLWLTAISALFATKHHDMDKRLDDIESRAQQALGLVDLMRNQNGMSIVVKSPDGTFGAVDCSVEKNSNFCVLGTAYVRDHLAVSGSAQVQTDLNVVGKVRVSDTLYTDSFVQTGDNFLTGRKSVSLERMASTSFVVINQDEYKTASSPTNATESLQMILALDVQTFKWLANGDLAKDYRLSDTGYKTRPTQLSAQAVMSSSVTSDTAIPKLFGDTSGGMWQAAGGLTATQIEGIDLADLASHLVAAVQEIARLANITATPV